MVRWLALSVALSPVPAGTAAPIAASDDAGNRVSALRELPGASGGIHCIANRPWCVMRRGNGTELRLVVMEGGPTGERELPFPIEEEGEGASWRYWDQAIVEADGAVLIGAIRTVQRGFSGASLTTRQLILLRAEPGGRAPQLVLDMPLGGAISARACSSAQDRRDRAGACEDRFELDMQLALSPAARSGRPQLELRVSARTWPGLRSPRGEEIARPPLRRRDLVWANDPACTYVRRLAVDPATGRYEPSVPVPDCSAYLEL